LAATAAASSAAVFLAACGGDGDSDQGKEATLLTRPADTTSTAKRGGVLKDRTYADPPTLDIAGANSPLNAASPHAYNTLVQFKPGHLKPAENEIGPDLAESWEWSPDGLQITLKLRPGVKFHNKPPVNGRALDMDDVLFSWNRFATKGSARAAVSASVDPRAPVVGLTATDARTVVLRLKEPLVYALGLFASNSSAGVIMLPKETDAGFDIRSDMIGTGPFALTNYTASIGFTFKRNPDYYDKDYALVDQIDLPIIPEYTSALAQFKAGNIYSFGAYGSAPKITAEDVIPVKREEPRFSIYQGDVGNPQGLGTRVMSFGWLPDGKSPFLDERVRQAVSLSWDRDLYLDTLFNIPSFEAEGLPVESRWNTSLLSANDGWWLNPRSRDFGPNAKFYEYNVAEAKKLLTAAGYPNGFETISSYVTGPELPTSKHAEIVDAMAAEVGIKSKVNGVDYSSVYIPRYRDGKGQYEGWGYMSTAGGAAGGDPVGALANEYYAKGGSAAFHGFSTSGKNDLSGDPQVDAMIDKARVERDTERRRALVFDLQRYLAKPVYALQPPGQASGFVVAWPCVGNFRVFQGGRLNQGLWVDETKPPFRTA
jgi:peptide/nickel transport system substrate-binding protein